MPDAILHICRPRAYLARAVRRCGCCKRRRRFTVLVTGWYGARWVCNSCGAKYDSEIGLKRESKRQRQERIPTAREQWKRAGTLREAIRQSLED